jgi:hypothetical protein
VAWWGAAVLCIGAAAHAGAQEEIFTESFTVANISGTRDVELPQFDPQGGCRELLKVTLLAEGVGTGNYSFTNNSDILCTGLVTLSYGATVTFPFPSGPPPILQCSQADSVGPIPIFLDPGETLDVPIDFQFSCTDMTEPADDLSPFIGTGTIVARYDGDQDTDPEVDCDFTESLDTDVAGTFTVTYEFDKTLPECTILGPDALCPGDQDVLYEVMTDPGFEIEWMIAGDAQFCADPAGGETALVCADPVCGDFTLTVEVSDPNFPDCAPATCTKTVVLEDSNPPVLTCPSSPQVLGCNAPFTFTVEATDNCEIVTLAYEVIFSPPASGTFTDNTDGTFTIEFTETGSAAATFTATDACGNTTDCVIDFSADCEQGEGCTPGYWKQEHHFCSWPAPYEPNQMFSMWFDDAFAGKSLLTVLSQPASSDPGPNQLNSLGRHTVAALLNAASLDVAYDLGPAAVIEMFNDAYPGDKSDYNGVKAIFRGYNEQGCPLGNCNPADLDGDDQAGVSDFLILIGNWGTGGAGDYDDSSVVDVVDLFFLFQYWES